MALEDYNKAYRMGKREYQHRMMKGQLPTLQVLDEILPPKGFYSEVPLGLVQIPVNQIVGYIMSGDPTYITSYNSARSLIMKMERDELVEEMLKTYIEHNGWV